MIKWLMCFIFIWLSLVNALPLTEQDTKNLTQRKVRQHIVYETYLETDKGLASVFGYQFDTYFNDTQCFVLAISGAVGGERGGYGFAAFGLGQDIPLSDQWMMNIRGFIGSGGGGGLDAGGGFMLEGHIGIGYKITSNAMIELNTGYLSYPTGTFNTMMINAGVSFTEVHVFLPWDGDAFPTH